MTDNAHINIKQVMIFLVVLIGMLVLFGVVTKENVIEAVSAMLVLTLVLKELLPDNKYRESKKCCYNRSLIQQKQVETIFIKYRFIIAQIAPDTIAIIL